MIVRRFPRLFAVVALLFLSSAVMGEDGGAKRTQQRSGESLPDLSGHPIYSKYEFGSDGTTIDIGIQPLWVPTSIISEVMKRDIILRDTLASMGLTIRFHSFLKGADVNSFLAGC